MAPGRSATGFRCPSCAVARDFKYRYPASTHRIDGLHFELRYESLPDLKTLPEVALVFSKNGNADLGTDPMPPNASDTYVILKPESEWPANVKSKDDVLKRIEARMKPLIGNRTKIQQPIQMRFNELIAGVRSDVAVKLYGEDLEQMTEQAKRIAGVLRATG
jgi:cobalt-zinc-cadmium resistance protein CzcA